MAPRRSITVADRDNTAPAANCNGHRGIRGAETTSGTIQRWRGSARRSTVWVPGIQGPSRLLEVQGASTYKLDIAGLLLNSYELLFRCNAGGATQDGTRLFLLHFIVRRDGQLPAGATSCRSVRRKARCIPGEATTRQPTGCLGSREPPPRPCPRSKLA